MFKGRSFVLPIQLKTKRLAEGRQRPFGGVGFRGLECSIVHLAWRSATTFPRSMPFPNNRGFISVNGDAHFGRIDRKEGTAVFPRQHTPRIGCLAAPGIEAEDPIG